MPKTLSKKDPNLVEAVNRLKRSQRIWGLLLIGLGAITEWAGVGNHPVAGLPLIAIGLFALVWAEPAVLAAVATSVAFSIVPTINPGLTILGPDPLRLALAGGSLIEVVALVVGKALIVLTSANQFLFYRFLYGTAGATSEDPEMAIVPAMVPNRTDGLARRAGKTDRSEPWPDQRSHPRPLHGVKGDQGHSGVVGVEGRLTGELAHQTLRAGGDA